MRIRQEWNKVPLKNKVIFVVSVLVAGSLYLFVAYFLIRGVTFGSKKFIMIAAFVVVSILLGVMSDKLTLRGFGSVEDKNVKKTLMFLGEFISSVFIVLVLLLVYLLLAHWF